MCRCKEKTRMVYAKYKLITVQVLFLHCVFLQFSQYLQWTYIKLIIVSICKTYPTINIHWGWGRRLTLDCNFLNLLKKKTLNMSLLFQLTSFYTASEKSNEVPTTDSESQMPLSTVLNLALQEKYIYIKTKLGWI